jgi:hypothetical protein
MFIDDVVVNVDSPQRYLALSYLWGEAKPLQLLKDDIEELGQSGSLTMGNGLPGTVEDAIQVTIKLGEKYL